jgi:hypothetical protein
LFNNRRNAMGIERRVAHGLAWLKKNDETGISRIDPEKVDLQSAKNDVLALWSGADYFAVCKKFLLTEEKAQDMGFQARPYQYPEFIDPRADFESLTEEWKRVLRKIQNGS